jgi:hypothetical protein
LLESLTSLYLHWYWEVFFALNLALFFKTVKNYAALVFVIVMDDDAIEING